MKNDLITYSESQQEQLERHIREKMLSEGDEPKFFSEMTPEYVKVDVCSASESLITVGVGARKTGSPIPDYEHIEFIMFKTPEISEKQNATACLELARLARYLFKKPEIKDATANLEFASPGRYPLNNDTWLGGGHTINASEGFAEEFGYEYFFFAEFAEEAEVSGIGKIHFLIAIPIYEEERNWMAERDDGSQRFINSYMESIDENDDKLFCIDYKRPVFIPKE